VQDPIMIASLCNSNNCSKTVAGRLQPAHRHVGLLHNRTIHLVADVVSFTGEWCVRKLIKMGWWWFTSSRTLLNSFSWDSKISRW